MSAPKFEEWDYRKRGSEHNWMRVEENGESHGRQILVIERGDTDTYYVKLKVRNFNVGKQDWESDDYYDEEFDSKEEAFKYVEEQVERMNDKVF